LLFFIGGRSEVVNDSHSVSKNKVVKYPFQVIQSLQNRFNLDDETTTQHNSLDTTNDDSATIRDDGNSDIKLIDVNINFFEIIN